MAPKMAHQEKEMLIIRFQGLVRNGKAPLEKGPELRKPIQENERARILMRLHLE